MKDIGLKYDITARLLHWISALVILWATISGLFIMLSNLDENIKHQISQFNISVTFIFIPFFLWRITHRLRYGVPSFPQSLSKNEVKIAKAMHLLLYTLVSVVLFTGIFMMEKDFTVFNLFRFPHLINDLNTIKAFEITHIYSTRILAVCIVLHFLALIKHEVKGNRILKRMI